MTRQKSNPSLKDVQNEMREPDTKHFKFCENLKTYRTDLDVREGA